MDQFTERLIQRGSPFELQDAVIKGAPCKIFSRGPQTLQDVFIKAASFKENEFVVADENRLTFSMMIDRAKKLAISLKEDHYIKKGERVALLMDNCSEWVSAFMGIYFAGAVAVTLHAESQKEAILQALNKTEPSLIITDQINLKKLENCDVPYTTIVLSDRKQFSEIKEVASYQKEKRNLFYFEISETPNDKPLKVPKPDADDEALISFTSGTTGTPKGVVFSHRNITTGLMNMMLGGSIMSCRLPKKEYKKPANSSNTQPCSLMLSPLSYIGGYSQIMLMSYLGGKIVLLNEWDANRASLQIEKEKIKSLSGASVSMIRELLRIEGASNKLATLTNVNVHGTALKRDFLKEINDKIPWITIGTGYGMTETCGGISSLSGDEVITRTGWTGPILPSVDVKVTDDKGNEKEKNNPGEVCIKGAMVMREYASDPDKTKAVLNNGWLKTGDFGYLDTEGNLYITDRLKDLIICENKKISARELENMASDQAMVKEVVAIGVPSSEKCEKIIVIIQTNNRQQIDRNNLKQYLSSRIEINPVNIKIIFVDFLPHTASGKVNRAELRLQVL